jgi:hypothetical protein
MRIYMELIFQEKTGPIISRETVGCPAKNLDKALFNYDTANQVQNWPFLERSDLEGDVPEK